MPERATINEVVQIGIEGTAGVAAVANRLLLSTSIELKGAGNINEFAPAGYKFATDTAIGKEWATGDISQEVADYEALAYLLAGCVRYAGTPTLQAGTAVTAGSAYTWTFTPSSASEDTIKTYTVEQGSSVRAHKAPYGLVNGLEISFDREKVSVSGDLIGAQLQDGITLSTLSGTVSSVPILPNTIDVYMDSVAGSIGTTKLTRAFSGSFKYGDRFSTGWPLNSAGTSFAFHVEKKPSAELRLTVEADAAGMALLSAARTSATRYFRIAATGGTILNQGGTAYRYLLQIDTYAEVVEPVAFSDEDGVYAAQFTLRPIHDSTLGRAFQITLRNTQTF